MSVKTIIQDHSKKIIGLALLTSFIAGQTVGASTTISDSIQSRGRITYDEDLDGTPEMKFDAQDLITTANGIDALNTDIALLSDSVSNLQDTTLAHKSNIIAGLNSNVYSKAPISNEATFEELIAYVNNIPAPTTATAAYYNDGDNTGQGISDPADEIDVNIEDTSRINLGINESITLPSGYYPNDITISNNVANRGSIDYLLTSTDNTRHFDAGYYDAFTVSTNISNVGGTVVFNHHVHSTTEAEGVIETNDSTATSSVTSMPATQSTACGCYRTRVAIGYGSHGHAECTGWSHGSGNQWKCDSCGMTWSDKYGPASGCPSNPIYGYACSLGYTNGQVISATIMY